MMMETTHTDGLWATPKGLGCGNRALADRSGPVLATSAGVSVLLPICGAPCALL